MWRRKRPLYSEPLQAGLPAVLTGCQPCRHGRCAVLEVFTEDVERDELCFPAVIDIICMQILILTRGEIQIGRDLFVLWLVIGSELYQSDICHTWLLKGARATDCDQLHVWRTTRTLPIISQANSALFVLKQTYKERCINGKVPAVAGPHLEILC